MAFDIGKKRTGVAITDPLKLIATGLKTIPTADVVPFVRGYILGDSVETIVIGYPTQMNNQPSAAVKYVTPIVDQIRQHFPLIPVELVDERFTSKLAFQAMIDGGLKKKDRQNKELVDTVSATIILQSYMESLPFKK